MRSAHTLRFRLTMWYCVTLTLAMFLLGVLMYGIVAWRLLRRQDGMLLKKAARILAILQQPGDGRVLTPAKKEALDHLGQNIVVHESQGSREVHYQSPEMVANPLAPPIGMLGRAEVPDRRFTTLWFKGQAWRVIAEPYRAGDDRKGVLRLVVTLNRMFARLESSFDTMRRFTADASHELRNPLATMRNTIDVILEQPRTADQQRAALESLGEDVDRLRKIVEDLLLLARADNGRLAMNRETVRLDNLVQALAEIQQPRAQERGVTVSLAASGPGIPDEDLERIFERFYQVDPSRAQRTGSGLGLAIAAWIVKVHEGRISAANHSRRRSRLHRRIAGGGRS